jgi:thymidine phosphorylase
LGDNCGNALEVREAVAFLTGDRQEPRLLEVTLALSAELLQLGGLAADRAHGIRLAEAALRSGLALQHFEKMVYALGGPMDFCAHHPSHLLQAPVQLPVTAERSGWVSAMDTRQIGVVVVGLGGGRQRASDTVDPRVGLANVAPIGQHVETGETLAVIHAASASDAQAAQQQLLRWIQIDEQPVAPGSLMLERILENPE